MKIETRNRGKDVRHVDGTTHCVPVVSKADHQSDERKTKEDSSWMPDGLLSLDEEEF